MEPFCNDINEIGNLTPRRKGYIEKRNIALNCWFDDIDTAKQRYERLISEVCKRYYTSKLEEQCQLKPYLMVLYFEFGQLLEAIKQPVVALRYYELAGLYGHPASIQSAKRLGSRMPFLSVEEANLNNLHTQNQIKRLQSKIPQVSPNNSHPDQLNERNDLDQVQ